MVNRNSEQERIYRIGLIISLIDKCGENGADKETLIAQFMVNYGIARRTMLEYIQALKLTEKIKEEGGLLFLWKINLMTKEEEEILNGN